MGFIVAAMLTRAGPAGRGANTTRRSSWRVGLGPDIEDDAARQSHDRDPYLRAGARREGRRGRLRRNATAVDFGDPLSGSRAGRRAIACRRYCRMKWASVVRPLRPLIGRMSWGHAERATTRSISALKTT